MSEKAAAVEESDENTQHFDLVANEDQFIEEVEAIINNELAQLEWDVDIFDRGEDSSDGAMSYLAKSNRDIDELTVITDITSTTKDHNDLSESDIQPKARARVKVSHDSPVPLLDPADAYIPYPQKEILLNSNISLPKGLMSYTVNKELTGLEAIRALPHHISGCVNSGNMKELRELIDTHFDMNCTFRSHVIEEYLTGRDYVFMLFEALLQAIPDYIFVTKKTTFVKNKAVNQVYFTGTRAFQARNQYLFQKMNCSMTDVIAKDQPLASEQRFQMKSLERALKEAGKKISVWGGGYMKLTFDTDTFKVTHFDADWNLRAFKESPYEESS